MGVSEYFRLIRENLGFLIILAFIMPGAVTSVELESGPTALAFMSMIGVAGGFITFEGITFDFQFFTFTAGSTLVLWFTGMIVVVTNVIIMFHVWQYSIGKKERREVFSSVAFMVALSFFLGGLSLIPLPWVGAAAVIRTFTAKREEKILIQFPGPAKEGGFEIHKESTIFQDPTKSAMQRRIPKFFIHGFAFSILDLIFGMMWPILTGIALASGQHLGSTGSIIAIAFSFGSLFVGGGLINAWLSEKIWKIDWDYGIGIVILSGVILFVVTQVMVTPLSYIINLILLDSIMGIAIVVVFRYTAVAFIIGIVGLLISFNFKPVEKPSDLLTQIEQVVDKLPSEEDSAPTGMENQ